MTNYIILIQSFIRKYLIKNKNKKICDGMTFELLNTCIDNYIDTIQQEKKINQVLKSKKIRLSNFPSHISENIAKFAIFNKYKIMPNWDIKKGDLLMDKLINPLRFEIKGSIDLSNGPPTFGPKESWNYIYFIDGKENDIKKYKVYEVKLSNNSDIWRNIKINNSQTFFDQCNQGRRPRINFTNLQSQLGDKCKLIFYGYLSELNNNI